MPEAERARALRPGARDRPSRVRRERGTAGGRGPGQRAFASGRSTRGESDATGSAAGSRAGSGARGGAGSHRARGPRARPHAQTGGARGRDLASHRPARHGLDEDGEGRGPRARRARRRRVRRRPCRAARRGGGARPCGSGCPARPDEGQGPPGRLFRLDTRRRKDYAIHASGIDITGASTKGKDAKIAGGAAAAGAIIGGIADGGSGAVKGGLIGGAAGGAAVLATRGEEIELKSGSQLKIELRSSLRLD
jgi:hypothetical protein